MAAVNNLLAAPGYMVRVLNLSWRRQATWYGCWYGCLRVLNLLAAPGYLVRVLHHPALPLRCLAATVPRFGP